jgi:transcriptional regulator with XRE-family HTH domain
MNDPTGTDTVTLLRLRTAAGLSQSEVADRLNALIAKTPGAGGVVTANAVSRWERGVVTPQHHYRRLLASLFNVSVEMLGFAGPPDEARVRVRAGSQSEEAVSIDSRVTNSQDQWRQTRRALNARRAELARLVAQAYRPYQFEQTGLLTHPAWIPLTPLALSDVTLQYVADAPAPVLDGAEQETSLVRPQATLTRSYHRYTQAIRDVDHPRLFENRPAWRLLDVGAWSDGGVLSFGPTTYFAAVDLYEATAHETAYVHLDDDGAVRRGTPNLRDLPFRKLIGDPFECARRPIMPAVDTLTIRRDRRKGDSLILHRRDPTRVASAGGMLQVIPSGIFQPSSVHPRAQQVDFDLWRNVAREYSEELLGNPEHDGDGYPIRYDVEPFTTLDKARADGQIRVFFLGIGLDALTLWGEILTVMVVDADLFDSMSADFVDVNDEGAILNERTPFTQTSVDHLLASGRLAPAGAGCIKLAWQHRSAIVD